MREGEEKQRRQREGREKAEAERAARAARKRALVDMNAHENQEGVMDSLMEALQTGSAFSRPDQRRKRQTRVAGGKFKLDRSRRTTTKVLWCPLEPSNTKFNGTILQSSVSQDALIVNNFNQAELSPIFTPATLNLNAFNTPTDYHQNELKNELLNAAILAPKRPINLPRISSFRRIQRTHKTSPTYGRIDLNLASPMFGKTPQRHTILKVPKNLRKLKKTNALDFNTLGIIESTGIVPTIVVTKPLIRTPSSILITSPKYRPINSATYASLYRETLLGEAHKLTPVKNKMVIVSKGPKRNSFVRRALINRGRWFNKCRKSKEKMKRQTVPYLGSPSSLNLSMPNLIDHTNQNTGGLFLKSVSKSSDDLIAEPKERRDTLQRVKNFDNIAKIANENNDNIQTSNDSVFMPSPLGLLSSMAPSLSPGLINDIHQLHNFDNANVMTMQEKDLLISPSNVINSRRSLAVYRSSDPPAVGKRRWKFWRKSNNDVLPVCELIKYDKLRVSDSDLMGKMKGIVGKIKRNSSTSK